MGVRSSKENSSSPLLPLIILSSAASRMQGAPDAQDSESDEIQGAPDAQDSESDEIQWVCPDCGEANNMWRIRCYVCRRRRMQCMDGESNTGVGAETR